MINKMQIKNVIMNGFNEMQNKRQKEIGPKIKQLISDYKRIIFENKEIFEEYHNSFYNGDSFKSSSNIFNFFSKGLNELELTEFDLDLIIDEETNMTLIDFIIMNKPDLSENNFSLGGSYPKIGIKFLEKIFISGDKEYIKYLNQIGFYGSPELYLSEIQGKKVIDYLLENYELYRNFCGKEFKITIKDYNTKQYLLNSIKKGKHKIINSDNSINIDKLFIILDNIDFDVNELFEKIEIYNHEISIFELYLLNNKLPDLKKIKNVILPIHLVTYLITTFFNTKDKKLKKILKEYLNNIYISSEELKYIDKITISKLNENSIILRVKEYEKHYDEENKFYYKLNQLRKILTTGINTSSELIEYIVANYEKMYKLGISFAEKEVDALILIKENNPKFHIEDSNLGPNFDNDTIHLILSDKNSLNYHGEDNYLTFNHEITHAIQYYCYNDNTPNGYYETLPDRYLVADTVASFCEKVISKMEHTLFSLEQKQDSQNIDNKNKKELREKIICYISVNRFGYEREVIDIFDTFLCFTDNLSKLGFENANLIEGHPYDYMKYAGYDFSEMLADYKSIMASGREDLISFVKSVLPMECTNFIEEFYESMLTNYISIYKGQNIRKKKKI